MLLTSITKSSVRLLSGIFFFNDTATTEIYTLSLHDALPISSAWPPISNATPTGVWPTPSRSEEHTSELQSHHDLVCRLLLEKKKNNNKLLILLLTTALVDNGLWPTTRS